MDEYERNDTPTESLSEKLKTETNDTWNIVDEVFRREYGFLSSGQSDSFATSCCSSSYIAQRMKLSHHLNQPDGTVKIINFNNRGDLICVGCSLNDGESNNVGLIDWASNEVKFTVSMEKSTEINDVHFLNAVNYEDQLNFASVYGNGQFRYDKLTPDGSFKTLHSARLSKECQKLAKCPNKENEILSASKSGKVFNIDLRCGQQEEGSTTLLAETIIAGTNVKLQAISHHPLAPQICASYDDYYVRTFDKRRFDHPIHEIMPEKLKPFIKKPAEISDCFYNYDGSEILAIYTDTEIYLLDSENNRPGQAKQSYHQMGYLAGFTNKTTFFGPKSEYVTVGDDGQRIAFIEKTTGKTVAFTSLWPNISDGRWCSFYFYDLKSHPHLPIVAAASGHFSILGPASLENVTKFSESTNGLTSDAVKPTKFRFFHSSKKCNLQ